MSAPRALLLDMFRAGVARVDGRRAVRESLAARPFAGEAHLVAVGKAAAAMTAGALDALGPRVVDGLVISKRGHIDAALARDARLACVESDHPVPGARSLAAGATLLRHVAARARPGARFLFLLSGGASSLAEAPSPGLSGDDLMALTRALLASGLDIAQMNRARRAVSAIKGGRLAAALQGCPTLNLLISDVPGDDPAVVGSGLLTPTREEFDAGAYPPTVRALLAGVAPAPIPDDALFANIDTRIVACLDDAKAAAAQAARAAGREAQVAPEFVCGDACAAARALTRALAGRPGALLVWGGETTLTLPASPGRGGRNQHLALAAAVEIDGDPRLHFLAAGTDGTDGPTDAAGGLVDGGTLARGADQGLDARDCLARADSGVFLEAAGDLLTTGPTGTNVMDLMIGCNMADAD